MKALRAVWVRLTRKPVLVGGLLLAWADAELPDGHPYRPVAIAAVALVVDALTEPKAEVAEKVEQARYVGSIEEQAIAPVRTAVAKAEAKK